MADPRGDEVTRFQNARDQPVSPHPLRSLYTHHFTRLLCCQALDLLPSNSHFSDCADFAKKSLVFWVEFRFYDSVGFLNDLIECVGRTCAGLADKRRGMN